MYLTYDEYRNMGGTTLEETAFYTIYFEAQSIIDWWTFNRLQNESEFPEAVKRCMYALIKLLNSKAEAVILDGKSESDSTVHAGIVSESNDGVSTTYNTLSAKDAIDTIQNDIKNTVNMYLGGVRNSLGHKLLYRGVYPDE